MEGSPNSGFTVFSTLCERSVNYMMIVRLPQGKKPDGVADAVVKVFPEFSVFDSGRHVQVGGCDYPYIGFLYFGRAYADEFTRFQYA